MTHNAIKTLAFSAALLAGVSADANVKTGYGWDLLATLQPTTLDGLPLIGVPLKSYDFGMNAYGVNIGVQMTGNADTIVRRWEEAEVPSVVPPSNTDEINIEMVAIQLATPFEIDLGWGKDIYFFTQSLTERSLGSMSITFDRDPGVVDQEFYGTFTSYLRVNVNIRKGCVTCDILTDGNMDPIVILKEFYVRADIDGFEGKGVWKRWPTDPMPFPIPVEIPGVNYLLNGSDRGWDFVPNGRTTQNGTIWYPILIHETPEGDTHAVVFATIPEPATWAMLIAGFGLVGFAARRRREVASA